MTFGVVMDPVLRSECGFAVSSFIGRRAEMREIKQRMSDCRLVTMTGPGGVGKSRLAHRMAVALRRAYQDRVYCVDLLEAHDARMLTHDVQDPDVLAHLIASTLAFPQDGTETATQALIAALAPRPALLLLDNCESRLPACAVLADTLLRGCPQLRMLATSREPLRLDGEMIFPVQPLPTPPRTEAVNVAQLRQCESMVLFVSRAEAVSDFVLNEQNAPATAELCRRLDGLPLAIELAAARMRTLTPVQMLQRTNHRFALLSRGNRTAPARQQTLRASVDWSYELCTKPEKQLWSRLSVFPEAFELDAVEGICADESLPAQDILDLVAALVHKSILISERSGDRWRYRMLNTDRDYGRNALIEAGGSDDIHRRHRNWYQALVRRAAHDCFGPRQGDWFTLLDQERANLDSALTYSLAIPHEAEAALEMAAELWPLWAARNLHTDGRRRLEQALAHTTEPTMHRMHALYGAAVLAADHGDLDAVRASVHQAHQVAAQLHDEYADAIATCAAGVLAAADADLSAATHYWRAAADRFTPEHHAYWRAIALTGLAATTAMLGDIDTATRCHDEIIELCRPGGESLLTGTSLADLGLALWKHGNLEQAAQRLRDSLRRLRRIDDQPGITQCLHGLAFIASDEHRAERAATLLGAAHRLAQTASTPTPPGMLSADHETQRRTRATLGEQNYRTAYARGAAMSTRDAIAYALDEPRRPAPTPRRATPASTPRQGTPATLTPRELQVAQLLAHGHSNKDIAATLVISQRTAESHVEKILTKLGLTKRTQVAAWMVGK